MKSGMIRTATIVGVVALTLGMSVPSGAAPKFKPNAVAFCAAGNALVRELNPPPSRSNADSARWFRATAVDYGRVAVAAPNQRVYAAFVAIQKNTIIESRDQKALASEIVGARNYSDAITLREGKEFITAYIAAAGPAAKECPNSTFAEQTGLLASGMGKSY